MLTYLPIFDPSRPLTDASSSAPPDQALVIIPTYNEANNVDAALEQVMLIEGVDALVIDDASPDGTAEVVEGAIHKYGDRIRLIRRKSKLGLGSAYLLGFREALRCGYTYICEMDADLSHDPSDLPNLIEPARTDRADLVIGSRYINGVRVMNWPLTRLVLSYGAGVYTRAITKLPVYDVTAGFKCYHRRVLQSLDLQRIRSTGYSFQVEMKYRAWRGNFRLLEVPVVFTERTEGQSKMSRAIVREAAFKVWELRFRQIFGRL